MVVVPATVRRCQEGLDRILLARRVALDFTAGANAQVRLDMRACRDLLQVNGDGFGAFDAFEGQGTGWFGHVDCLEGGRETAG